MEFRAILIVLSMSLVTVPAYAGTDTTSFETSLNVEALCSVRTVPINFGDVVIESPGVPAAEAIRDAYVIVNCTNGLSYQVAFNFGLHFGAVNPAKRHLRRIDGSDNFLWYVLTSSTGGELGDSCSASTYPFGECFSRVADGNDNPVMIDSILYGNPSAVPGEYRDSVTVTVIY